MTTRILGPPPVARLLARGLWGEVSWANVISGVVVTGAISAWVIGSEHRSGYRVHPLGVLRLLGVLLVDLTLGSFRVAAAVLWPSEARLHAEIVEVELASDRPFTTTVVADMLSLVPGSLALDTLGGPPHLEVHVMGHGSVEEVRSEVARIEALGAGRVRADRGAGPQRGVGRGGVGRGGGWGRHPGGRPVSVVYTVALTMIGIAAAVSAAWVVRTRLLVERAIGIDAMVAVLVNGLAVAAAQLADGLFLELVLLTVVLGFLGTVAASCDVQRRNR